ncbi:MAG TPA: hypothetical protein PLX87_10275 [Bacteroidales bacterium]|nr:hypothetical protein [Bacteroidales bacterium]HOK74772.1 hypothetical protein [Bacteroidales bacterium]HOM41628.1 hypothetical protein [Bacteroidales bacterium]HOU30825.1 hypothetical protein [Bacteroidales bacterium]HPP93279.1 hypothetical protein [Bacteroidales bacterium]
MKKILLVLITVICVITAVNAQDYKTGIGLRGGFFNGLTVKHFVKSNAAIEGLLFSRWKGFEITGLYEFHAPAFQVDRFKWYFGPGAHIGFYNGDNTTWGEEGKTYTNLGIDGILGLEYSISQIPINIGLDWKPEFNIIGYSGFWYDAVALSIRFIF